MYPDETRNGPIFREWWGLFALWLGVWLLAVAAPAEASRAKIEDQNVTVQNGTMRLQATVENAFTQDINNLMLSGIPIVIDFQLRVTRRKPSPSERLVDGTFSHSVTYNNLTSQYTVEVRRGIETETFLETDFSRVRSLMTTVDYRVDDKNIAFVPGGRYKVDLKAKMDEQKIPFDVEFLLYLFRNPIDTPWQSTIFEPVFRGIDQIDREE